MITGRQLCLRWRDRRSSWRPGDEPFDWHGYEAAEIRGEGSDTIAAAFIARHHYSGRYVAAQKRYGLYRGPELVGVAVFSVSMPGALACLGAGAAEGTELGRFVLLDSVEGCGESKFVAWCFRQLRGDGFSGVISFSDPVSRVAADGRSFMPGHVGVIYQSTSFSGRNAVLLGRSKADKLHFLPDGTVFHRRALQKVRGDEGGEAIDRLVAAGAPRPRGDLRAWVDEWLPRVSRAVPHPGNFKYAWGLDRAVARHLPASLPYPEPPGGRVAPKWGRRALLAA